MKKQPKYKKNTAEVPEYTWGGALSGFSTGASLGSAIGTAVPVIGNIVGGVAGGLIGGVAGWITSDEDKEREENRIKQEKLDVLNANTYSKAGARNTMGQTTQFPYGGMMPAPNAEVEGGEVLKQPNGQVDTMQGPSHAEGGIPINAPQGTKVYSDRLKHKVGNKTETFAETADKLNKLLDKYKKDDKTQDTVKRKTDALMISRVQQQLDMLFAEQEAQKEQQNIQEPAQNMVEEPGYNITTVNPKYMCGGKMAYGGTTGWPIEDNAYYYDNQEYFDANKGQSESSPIIEGMEAIKPVVPLMPQNMQVSNSLRGSTNPNAKIYQNVKKDINATDGTLMKKRFDAMTNGPWNYSLTGNEYAPTIKPTSVTSTIPDASIIGKVPERGLQTPTPQEEQGSIDWGNAISTVAQAAPMVYNLLSKKPDEMKTGPYMNTDMMEPKRMDSSQDLREAERTYSAIINNQSLPAAQRLLASRQLQSVKNQILSQQNNQYKQDINRTEEANANIRQRNIETAMKIKDVNDANIAAYANMRAQAAGDISQLAQKTKLESNMAKNNTMMMNALKTTFKDFTFKNDGTILQKNGKPLTAEQMQSINSYLSALQAYNSYGGAGYLNEQTSYYPTYQYFNPNYGKQQNNE